MSERKDIIDGSKVTETTRFGLIYTCKCGWIDLGHARPDGASKLWKNVNGEIGPRSANGLWYRLSYSQMMGKFGLTAGVSRDYAVRLGLSQAEKESIALAIFMDVSIEFERYQTGAKFSWFTSSGFSAEDLLSNLIGFYRAVRPGVNYIQLCEPVSWSAADRIWGSYGDPGRQLHKVREFKARLFPCSECAGRKKTELVDLPNFLSTITPAQPPDSFRPWKDNDPDLTTVPSSPPPLFNVNTYRVQPGDTLSKIAQFYYKDMFLWPIIYDANRTIIGPDHNLIHPNQVLLIPSSEGRSLKELNEIRVRGRNWRVQGPPRR